MFGDEMDLGKAGFYTALAPLAAFVLLAVLQPG